LGSKEELARRGHRHRGSRRTDAKSSMRAVDPVKLLVAPGGVGAGACGADQESVDWEGGGAEFTHHGCRRLNW
jgi:hypothetical protein